MIVSKPFKIIVMISLLFLLACARHVPEANYRPENAKFNLLIAASASDFKDGVRDRIVDRYKERGNIDVTDISGLKNVSCGNYDAILVMDTCKAWTWFNFSLKSFLKRSKNCHNVVLYLTAGDPEWTYQYENLDAVTSASVVENEDAIANQLSLRLDRIING